MLPTAREIINFLKRLGFFLSTPPDGWNEEVCVKPLRKYGVQILVATTIDRSTGEVRAKGTDAFRYQIRSLDGKRFLYDDGSTRRSERWEVWMKKKIQELELKTPGILDLINHR